MHAYEAIEQSLTFIEEHLTKEISTEELANTVGLSPPLLFSAIIQKAGKQTGSGICEATPFGKGY